MKKKVIWAVLAFWLTQTAQAQQIPGMGFDTWSRTGGSWYPYAKEAPAAERVWDSANKGLSLLGVNTTTPEYDHVAVPGKGKAAAKVVSKKVLWAFVAGNLFTGRFNKVVDLSGADLDFGVPFTGRPKSLSGYVHYIPKPVNYAKEPYLDRKGRPDVGRIEVILTDWEGLKHVDTTEEPFVDADKDPHLIARAVLDLEKDTGGYIPFEIPFKYRNGKTPRYAFIYVTPSRDGGSFTGGSGSTMYVDEFRFNY